LFCAVSQEALRVLALSLHEPAVEAAAAQLIARHPPLADALFERLAQAQAAHSRDKHHAATASRAVATEEERLVEAHRVFPVGPLIAVLACAGVFAYISKVKARPTEKARGRVA
jgi:hypothetical protein